MQYSVNAFSLYSFLPPVVGALDNVAVAATAVVVVVGEGDQLEVVLGPVRVEAASLRK